MNEQMQLTRLASAWIAVSASETKAEISDATEEICPPKLDNELTEFWTAVANELAAATTEDWANILSKAELALFIPETKFPRACTAL